MRISDWSSDVCSSDLVMEFERGILWGTGPNAASLGVLKPFDGQPAAPGNGPMVALAADSRATVDRVYQRALELGATDEGPAGPRGDSFYAGYFRDLDGNKLAIRSEEHKSELQSLMR